MTQTFAIIASPKMSVSLSHNSNNSIRFEKLRNTYKEGTFMREANARLYLDNSKVYAEIAQLALPVGDEDFNRMCREATKRMIEEEKRMTEKQAVNYLTNSLQIVKNQPLALLPELEAMGIHGKGRFFVFGEDAESYKIECDNITCPYRSFCSSRNIDSDSFKCRYTGKEFEFCEECGALIDAEKLNRAYNAEGKEIFICGECLHSNFQQCEDCGEWFSKDHDFIEVENFGPICQDCYDNGGFFYCEECEKTYTEDCAVYIEGKEVYVCEDCAEENYYKCDFCGRYTDYDHAIFSQDYPQTCICHDCYDSGSYEICASCGTIVCTEINDFGTYTDNGYYCADCAPENTAVRAYGYKPKAVFHKSAKDPEKGNLYFGIELEFSHDSYGYREENLNKAIDCLNSGEFEKDYYFKEDSSLECGFETVSHPRTLSSWLEEREKFEKWLSFVAGNVLEGRDGLHIHISRKGMTIPHMTRFSAFMSMYSEQARIIARRNSTYSTYREKPHNGREVKGLLRNRSRYEAVNWENTNTVELRIFRNTTSVTTFFACIEFAHALYQFTKNHCSLLEILKGKAWIEFLKFLNTDTRYQDLREFLSLSFKNDTEHEEEYRILNKKKLDLSLVKYCLA